MPKNKIIETPRYRLSKDIFNMDEIENISVFIFDDLKKLDLAHSAISNQKIRHNSKVNNKYKFSEAYAVHKFALVDSKDYYLLINEAFFKKLYPKAKTEPNKLDNATSEKIKNAIISGVLYNKKSLKYILINMIDELIANSQHNDIVTDNFAHISNETRYRLPAFFCGMEASEKISLILCTEQEQKKYYIKYAKYFKKSDKKDAKSCRFVERWMFENKYYIIIREDILNSLNKNANLNRRCEELYNGDKILEDFKKGFISKTYYVAHARDTPKMLKNRLEELIALKVPLLELISYKNNNHTNITQHQPLINNLSSSSKYILEEDECETEPDDDVINTGSNLPIQQEADNFSSRDDALHIDLMLKSFEKPEEIIALDLLTNLASNKNFSRDLNQIQDKKRKLDDLQDNKTWKEKVKINKHDELPLEKLNRSRLDNTNYLSIINKSSSNIKFR